MENGKDPGWQERGLTIIELLATLAILGMIIAALYSFYLSGLHSWSRCIDRIEEQQSARIAIDKIIKEVRYAHAVEIRYNEPTMIYYRININGISTLHRFRNSAGQLLLERRRNNDTHYSYNVIALGLSALFFEIDANNTVHITIRVGNDPVSSTLTGSVRPLNLQAMENDE
ncbi:MAG: prepilin-type N-terminal cleavage/methylation domain-containing protein [Dethiobacteria bacterium]|nr:prepilin-type N-terminal cleavage/methylation domain-containing protein [Dethiobacteria bacterium]